MKTLSTPPLLIGVALALWGWQTDLLLLGALMGLIIEASRVLGLRWDLSEKDFRRLWDFTVFLFLAAALYLFTSSGGAGALVRVMGNPAPAAQTQAMSETAQAMLMLFQWMPMIFFLFVTAQAYSTTELVPWTVFSLIVRRRAAREKSTTVAPGSGLNTANRYLAICLLASCVPVRPNEAFYPLLGLLVAWALWVRRSARYAAPVWVTLIALALVAGYFGQRGFYQGVLWANARSAAWLAELINRNTDPLEVHTALGEVGSIKLSGRIVLRLVTPDGRSAPPLLREASYRFFRFPDWAGAGRVPDFATVLAETNGTTWELAPRLPAQHTVTIAQYLTGRGSEARQGLLALPQGVVRLERLAAFVVQTNRLGVVRVEEGPGLVVYDASYRQGSTIDASPNPHEDLLVPTNESPALVQIANELRLAGKSTNEILRAVSSFFLDHFRYSTWLPSGHRSRTNLTALSNFLLRDRAGHCEYFATAATLLLRKAGLPARYAVGYSVQEKSGRTCIVRQRHAHAWCLVWVDGSWHDFDVTPPSWVAAEEARAPWTEWFTDAISRLWFEFSRWRWGQAHLRDYLFWILPPIVAIFLIRLVLSNHWKRLRRKVAQLQASPASPGSDSEFYRLERELAARGLPRRLEETPRDWLDRLGDAPLLRSLGDQTRTLLGLHYRLRFDPAGLTTEERDQLKAGVQSCTLKLRQRPAP